MATRAGPALVLEGGRIYLLPTAQGLGFGLSLVVMLLGSANYNNSLGYLLSFLLGALGLVSMLHAQRNLKRLMVRPGRAPPVFAGQTARLGVCLDNPGPTPRPALSVRAQRGARRARGPRSPWIEAWIGPEASTCVELPVPTTRRGTLRLDRVTLRSRYPLGLFRVWSHAPLELRCLVYPRPAGSPELPAAEAGAQAREALRGEAQDDFAGFRDYQPGDSPRRVYWKGASRQERLLVKVFRGGGGGVLRLRWPEGGTRDSEARLSQLCLWVLEAERGGHVYALELPGRRLPPDRGEAHQARCLEALATFGEPAHG